MAPRTFANLPKVDILGGKGEGVSTVEDDPIILPEEEDLETDPSKDIVSIELPDGSVTINIGGILNKRAERGPSGFDENLAEELSNSELARIAEDLLEAIQSDEDSRREWLDIRAAGIDLLGLKVEKPKTDTSTTSAPLEGMSNVQHPLLLEAVLRFQANASGELLPTDGPVKIRVDDFNTPNPANTPSTTSDLLHQPLRFHLTPLGMVLLRQLPVLVSTELAKLRRPCLRGFSLWESNRPIMMRKRRNC